MLPSVVVHADWGTDPKKRVAAAAHLLSDGRYGVGLTYRVGQSGSPQQRLGICPDTPGTALVGFDFPIGVPAAYAERAVISSFGAALAEFGEGEWGEFYNVCLVPEEINVRRPFFPNSCPKAGLCRREHLTSGLGIAWQDLHRQCERKTAARVAGSPLFWTLGGKQVGKAAISGWREFIQPMVKENQAGLWPFDGPLGDLLRRRSCVIVETYPAELYSQLGVRFPGGKGGGKTSQTARKQLARQLLSEASGVGAELSGDACGEVVDGFGGGRDGEDRFDAMIGLLGMLKHVIAGSPVDAPPTSAVTSVEGWMLGQQPD